MSEKKVKQSSGEYLRSLRPKFLDWMPPTEEEKAVAVKARSDAREAELARVTELAKTRELDRSSRQKSGASPLARRGRRKRASSESCGSGVPMGSRARR
jgi:hypothetical protein